jgi:hypothetical protein
MQSALGVLKWTPQVFWQSTFYEYTAAMLGHLQSQGIKVHDEGMTRDEYLDLKAQAKARGLL